MSFVLNGDYIYELCINVLIIM